VNWIRGVEFMQLLTIFSMIIIALIVLYILVKSAVINALKEYDKMKRIEEKKNPKDT
jgi:hypothetical protein